MTRFQDVDLIEQEGVRNQFIDRVDVLGKVKELLTLPNTELCTTKIVADYYEVPSDTVRSIFKRHKDELTMNGVKVVEAEELKQLKTDVQDAPLLHQARSLTVYSKRAVLNIGMLLRDSKVAQEVRSQLLNITETVSNEQKEQTINMEMQLMYNVIKAKNDFETMMAMREYDNFKNQHIAKLNATIEEYKPDVEFSQEVLKADGTVSTTQIAKEYGMSCQALNHLLNMEDIIYKKAGQWHLYAQYQDRGYMKSETTVNNGFATVTNGWTQKGRKFLYEKLKGWGYVPLNERG